MIFKNPSYYGSTVYVDFIDRIRPKMSVEGCVYYDAIAYEATTAKMVGALIPTASGWVFNGFQTQTGTGAIKTCVCLESVASGAMVRCAVEGFVEGVNISGTGTVTTGYSTFTRGHAVYLSATAHLINSGATWVGIYNQWTTAAASTASAVIGVAMSSGVTATVDLYLLGKFHNNMAAS